MESLEGLLREYFEAAERFNKPREIRLAIESLREFDRLQGIF